MRKHAKSRFRHLHGFEGLESRRLLAVFSFPEIEPSPILGLIEFRDPELHIISPDPMGGFSENTKSIPIPEQLHPSEFCRPLGNEIGIAATAETFLIGACDSPIVEINYSGEVLRTIPNPRSINAMAFVDGKIFTAENHHGEISAIDYYSGKLIRRFPIAHGQGFPPNDGLTFDGVRLLTVGWEPDSRQYKIDEFDPKTGEYKSAGSDGFRDADSLAASGGMLAIGEFRILFRSLDDLANEPLRPISPVFGDWEGLGSYTPPRRIRVGANANVDDILTFQATALTANPQQQYFIRVYDPQGILVANDLYSTSDDASAEIQIAANHAGNYSLEIAPTTYYAEEPSFEISVDGASNLQAFSGIILNLSETVAAAVDQIFIQFGKPIDEDTISATDLTVNGVPALSVEVTGRMTAVFAIPETVDGTHLVEMSLGSISGTNGEEFSGIRREVRVDTAGPQVTEFHLVQIDPELGPYDFEIALDEEAVNWTQASERDPAIAVRDERGRRIRTAEFLLDGNRISGTFERVPNGNYDIDISKFFDAMGNLAEWRGSTRFTVIRGDIDESGIANDVDIDLMCSAIRGQEADDAYDLNGDGTIDMSDFDELILNMIGTAAGDANVDLVFNSQDLVAVFKSGEYEDSIFGNSQWSEGDWNCDGDFASSDLVTAFRVGNYTAAAKTLDVWQIAAAIDGDFDDDKIIWIEVTVDVSRDCMEIQT